MKIDYKTSWRDLPPGGIIDEGGTSVAYKTGGWRSQRPVWDAEKCINCFRCWISCPDSAIQLQDGKVAGIDYNYCKGCGVCASVCPEKVHAIDMKPE